MNRYIFCLLCTLFYSCLTNAQTAPKREMRAVWFSTFLNLDWPNSSEGSVQKVKDSVAKLLDIQQQAGINAIYFQVRSECDAAYNSKLEPWSASITGVQGNAPANNFDPLQFMIDECRKRGIEIHAWLNPYRAVNNYHFINNYASSHVAKTHPEWLLQQGTLRILNPGIPAVRDYIISVMMDIVRRYDVDGIHYDDYFYPYPGAGGTSLRFNDDETFAANARGIRNKNDWRRDNINLFIQRSYDSIKATKPWVKFGVSPFGIWRNQNEDGTGSATSGLQSYSDVFADTKKWLQKGWVDYVIPQIYWSTSFSTANYAVLVSWWNKNANNRHIYVGQAVYKIATDADVSWHNPSQINKQVRLNRTYNNIEGSTFFRTRYFSTNPLHFKDSLQKYIYTKPALLPTMPWRDDIAPQPVSNVTTETNHNTVHLKWNKPATTTNEMDKVKQFVVYRFSTPNINLNNSDAIQHITANNQTTSFTDSNLAPAAYYYVVTSLDRLHNESVASNVQEVLLLPTNTKVTPAVVTPTVVTPTVVVPKVVAPVIQKDSAIVIATTTEFDLKASPNPTTTHSIISYSLTKRTQVLLVLFDKSGKEIMKLVDGIQSTGKQLVRLNTSALPAGNYNLQISVDTMKKTIEITVTK